MKQSDKELSMIGVVSVMIEEYKQIRRTQRTLKGSRRDSQRMLKDKWDLQGKQSGSAQQAKRTADAKHRI